MRSRGSARPPVLTWRLADCDSDRLRDQVAIVLALSAERHGGRQALRGCPGVVVLTRLPDGWMREAA